MKKIVICTVFFLALPYTECYIVSATNSTNYKIKVDIQSAINTHAISIDPHGYGETNTGIACPWKITVSQASPSGYGPAAASKHYRLLEHCSSKDITVRTKFLDDNEEHFILE